MSSPSSSSSSHVTPAKVSIIIEAFGCILSDADTVLEKLERRFRLSDVEKLSGYVRVLVDYVDQLALADSGSIDLPLVDDQSTVDSEDEVFEESDDEL